MYLGAGLRRGVRLYVATLWLVARGKEYLAQIHLDIRHDAF
jgi:hypothetical protein